MELIEIRAEDFCCFQQFVLPLQNQGLVWVTGDNRDTKAANNNGSGKSTLFKALTWGLYGQTIDGERGDKVIRQGQARAKVEVVLSDDKGEWIVLRERRKGVPKLQLIQPDGKPFEAGKDVLQDRIIEMVGLDFAAFKNTILYGQNDSARFAHPNTKDVERKEMLHRILKTGILKHCHEWALEKRRESKTKLGQIDDDIDRTTLLLEEQDVDGLQADVDEYERERATIIEECREDARSHKKAAQDAMAKAEAGQPITANRAQLEAAVSKGNSEMEAAQDAASDAAGLADDIEIQWDARIGITSEAARVDASLSGLKRALSELEHKDRCPTCNSPLDKGEAKRYLGMVRKTIKEHRQEHKVIQERIRVADENLGALKTVKAERDAVAAESRNILIRIKKTEEQLVVLDKAEAWHKAAAEAAEERVRVSIERARGAIKRLREAKDQPNPHEVRLKVAKSKTKTLKKQRKASKADKRETADNLAHVEFWVRGFSNQGLPSYILDAVMPYVGVRANHYLETLADGDITMDFRTQREMKSAKGEFRDEIDITWEIEGLEDSYPPSGGQLKKMEIATDLALMDLVATREGNSPDILALDEVLDGLDPEGRQRVLMVLGDLRARRGSVFVISHESEMSEMFEKSVVVIKEDGVARLAS